MANVIVPNKKEPVISLILSLFIPGLGHIYNAQIRKGIIIFIAFLVSLVLIRATMRSPIGWCFIVFPIALWLYGMFDAFGESRKINDGKPSKDWLT